jgi:sulfite reductase (NADPH) hemoprotein beta-component
MSESIPAPAAKPLTKNELLKTAHPTLDGAIRSTLADTSALRFSEDDEQFIKFHGMYQQDDRDKRKAGKEYSLMVRTRQTGGVTEPETYLVYDELAGKYCNGTLRLTTRQTFQFHGVAQSGIGKLIRAVNEALSTTIATCGDVNRNVLFPSIPTGTNAQKEIEADGFAITNALLPSAMSYHDIWVDGNLLNLRDELPTLAGVTESGKVNPYQVPAAVKNEAGETVDPLYGKTYLPRKFKIAFSLDGVNDTDIFANDMGFIAVVENDKVVGYNLLVGGGLGMAHGNKETFARLADIVGYFPRAQLIPIAYAVLGIHRDFGDRTNRKRARIKYVIADRGIAWFREELGRRLGGDLAAHNPFKFHRVGDTYGWAKSVDGTWNLTVYVPSGRIKDDGDYRLRTALREIVGKYKPEFRCTAFQNFILCGIRESDKASVEAGFRAHGVDPLSHVSNLRLSSMACVSLPTCGLALAEAEREMPAILTDIEGMLATAGLGDEDIIIRVTGCPNGCGRSHISEIGFVGRAPGKYNLNLGANATGTRLNRLYKESVRREDFSAELLPLFTRFKAERASGERFGDYCDRVILPAADAARAAAAVKQ